MIAAGVRCGAAVLSFVAASAHALTVPIPGAEKGIEVSGYLEGLAVVGTEGGQDQSPQGLTLLRADGAVSKVLRGHLELRGWLGGPIEGGHPGLYNLVHAFQNTTPALEFREAYAELRVGRTRMRAGIQQFAWGRLDGIPPTDVLNPRDFHDPFVTEFEDQKVGVPALSMTYDAPDFSFIGQPRLLLAYVPVAVPSRLPLLQERWFPSSIVPKGIVANRRDVEFLIDRALPKICDHLKAGEPGELPPQACLLTPPDVEVASDVRIANRLRTRNRRPPLRFEDGAIGFRLTGRSFDTDWGIYHYTGPETQLNGALSETTLISRTAVTQDPTINRRITIGNLVAQSALEQAHSRIHMTGFDLAHAFEQLTVRAEAAFFQDRPYLRLASDLINPTALRGVRLRGNFFTQSIRKGSCSLNKPCRGRVELGDLFPHQDSIEWGIGADTIYQGVFALLQLNQISLLDDAPRLIIADPDTRLTTLIRRRFLQDRFEAELRAAYSIERGGWFAFPRISYNITDDIRVRLGYVMLGGSRNSLIGQFGNNDEVVLQARYSF